MPGLRTICIFCKNDVLNRDYGLHIIKKHKEDLFADKFNLRGLHSDVNFRKPLQIILKDENYYFCFADNSCIRKETIADTHFKGRADAHREAMIALREQFPLGGSTSPSESNAVVSVQKPLLDEKDKKALQELIMMVFVSEDVAMTKKMKQAFQKLGLATEEDDLKALYPHHPAFQKEDEEEEEDSINRKEQDQQKKYLDEMLTLIQEAKALSS